MWNLDDYEDFIAVLNTELLESRKKSQAIIETVIRDLDSVVDVREDDEAILFLFLNLAKHLNPTELSMFARFPKLSRLVAGIPARTGIAWTPEEDEHLELNLCDETLARLLQRTVKAVKTRRAKIEREEFVTE